MQTPTMPIKWLSIVMLLLAQATAWGQMRLDSTFGTNAIVKMSLDDYTEPVSVIKLDNDTMLLLANLTPIDTVTRTSFALIKLTPDGKIDSTYGTNGYVRYHFYRQDVSVASSMVRLANGQVMVLGKGHAFSRPSYLPFSMMKLNVDGKVDSTFGLSGTLNLSFAGTEEFPTVIKQNASGSILVGGYTIDTADTHSNMPVVARMDTNGVLDTTFGNQGKLYINYGTGFISRHLIGGVLNDLLELPDGTILASGGYSDIYNLVALITHILPSGTVDTGFMGKGYFDVDFTPLYNSQIIRMRQATDGHVWFGASTNAIQGRDYYYGYLDMANESYNSSSVDYTSNEDVLTDLQLDDHGNPILIGKSISPAHNTTGYVSDYFAIDHQPAASFPFYDQKYRFSEDTALQGGPLSSVIQSNDRLVCYGFQNMPNGRSQLMLMRIKLSTTLAVADVATDAKNLVAYPNPATTVLHLKLPANVTNVQVAVYNSVGTLVLNKTNTIDIDVSGLVSGMYWVRVAGDGFDDTKAFLKE